MCEASTVAAGLKYASYVAALYGTYSTVRASRTNAAIAEDNENFRRAQAKDAIDRGQIREEALRREVAAVHGRQQSQLAAGGVELDSGSASDVLADTIELGELDALTVRSNAQREAYGYEVSANSLGAQSGAIRQQGYAQGAGLLLSGAAQGFEFEQKRKSLIAAGK